MKYIQKGKEPKFLKQYRSDSNSSYEKFRGKDDLRESLLKEQGHLCCYCMQRISKTEMKIEHWKSQSKYPSLQLTYKNLLGACKGNQGHPKHLQHCDTSKSDQDIMINPLFENCESLIHYGIDGRIYSFDKTINHDLDRILNLNQQSLKKNRKAVIDGLIISLKKLYPHGSWTVSILHKEIIKWHSLNNEKYNPYCQVVVYYLKKKLNQTV